MPFPSQFMTPIHHFNCLLLAKALDKYKQNGDGITKHHLFLMLC
jgi:hypothetical protein